YARVAQQYRALKAHHLDATLFRQLVLDVAAPIPADLNQAGLTPHQESARRRLVAKRSRLSHLWERGAGHAGDHSAWEAYNSVAQSVDHDETLWRVRGSRAESLLDGRLLEVKEGVLNSLAEAVSRGF